MKNLIAYIPVFHQGYINLIEDEKPDKIFLISKEIVNQFEKDFPYLSRSFLHAVGDNIIESFLRIYFPHIQVLVVNIANLKDLISSLTDNCQIILPQEDVSEYFRNSFLLGAYKGEIIFTNKYFLRWNQHSTKSEREPVPDEVVSSVPFDLETLRKTAYDEAHKSADWWRQVGAVLFEEKTGKVILFSHNKHLPYQNLPNVCGDARAHFNPGESPELVTAIHAEQLILMNALRQHLDISKLSLYSTTYPCPVCAKLIAFSGVSKLYYSEGYAVMEQAGNILQAFGVSVIHVPLK